MSKRGKGRSGGSSYMSKRGAMVSKLMRQGYSLGEASHMIKKKGY
jgi:hypothetical protein